MHTTLNIIETRHAGEVREFTRFRSEPDEFYPMLHVTLVALTMAISDPDEIIVRILRPVREA